MNPRAIMKFPLCVTCLEMKGFKTSSKNTVDVAQSLELIIVDANIRIKMLRSFLNLKKFTVFSSFSEIKIPPNSEYKTAKAAASKLPIIKTERE